MKYIIQDDQNNKMIMEVVTSVPELPEEWTVLGRAEDLTEELAEIESAKDKEVQVQAAYDSMNEDIFNQMELVFGTRRTDSATAHNETFRLMVESPADFINDTLVDEAAVTAYAQGKLDEIKAYAVYRLNRIAQFQSERDAILNG